MNMTRQLAAALESGCTLSSPEITMAIGLRNPREAIRQLRAQGLCIYTNPKGYRLGTATKEMISAIARRYGARAFQSL